MGGVMMSCYSSHNDVILVCSQMRIKPKQPCVGTVQGVFHPDHIFLYFFLIFIFYFFLGFGFKSMLSKRKLDASESERVTAREKGSKKPSKSLLPHE